LVHSLVSSPHHEHEIGTLLRDLDHVDIIEKLEFWICIVVAVVVAAISIVVFAVSEDIGMTST
jgi:hypothetical protein